MEMNYVAPELEVLEVMVEKGFGASDFGTDNSQTNEEAFD